MPTASALAMALGIFSIGINLLLTSLVCNEIAVIWNELDSEVTEIRSAISSASETLQETHRQKRHSHFALDGESTMRSARIVRRRLLKKLRNKHAPFGSTYYPIAEEYRADPFVRRQEKCNCQSFKNKCPVGPPGEKGKSGSRGLDGPDGIDGLPGASENDQYRESRPKMCHMCPAGLPGIPGAIGPTGASGPEGPPGFDGPPGKDADVMMGPVGPPGEPGPDGPEGKIGLIGVEGGPAEIVTPGAGDKGPPGPPGGVGPQGEQGNPGPPGPTNIIIGEPGRQGPFGRPGRAGAPGPVGIPGPVGERECECFVYMNEATKHGYIPIVDTKRFEIRRAPPTPEVLPQPGNVPVASQITVQKKGELVTPVERKTLYNYTQSGLVDIAQAKPPKTPVPNLKRGPPLPAWKSASTTEEPQRYRYISDKEYAASIPANIFAKRNRIQGTSIVAPARAFAVENDLISIQRPKKLDSDETKTVVLEKIIGNKKHHRAHGARTFTPTRIGMPLSQANKIGGSDPNTHRKIEIAAHLVRSRRRHPPSGNAKKNNKLL